MFINSFCQVLHQYTYYVYSFGGFFFFKGIDTVCVLLCRHGPEPLVQ